MLQYFHDNGDTYFDIKPEDKHKYGNIFSQNFCVQKYFTE